MKGKIILNCESKKQSVDSPIRAQQIAKLGSWEWNMMDNTQVWSDEVFRIYGYEPFSVNPTYQLFFDSIYELDKERALKAMDNIVSNEAPYALELRIHTNDGQLKWIHSQGFVYKDDQGKPIRMVGTVEDITDRKNAENEVSVSELKYNALFTHANDGIIMIDKETLLIIDINKSGAGLLNYSIDELINRPITELFPVKNKAFIKRKISELVKNGKAIFQSEQLKKDGTNVHVEISSTVFNIGGKEVFQSFVRDISDRKTSEIYTKKIDDLLIESENEHRIIFENAAAGIMILDDQTKKILNSNAAMSRILGYSKDEFQSMSLLEIVPINLRDDAKKYLNQLKDGDVIFESDEIHKNGSLIPVRIYLSKAKFRNGLKVIVGNIIDISESRKKQKSLEESERKFRKLTESAKDSIVVANSNNEIIFWNKGAVVDFEYSEAEILGKSLNEIFPLKYHTSLVNQMDTEVIETKEDSYGERIELSGKKKSGQEFPIELRITTWKADGEIYFCSIIRDITKRKLIEKRLLLSDTILRNIGNFVLGANENGEIFYASSSISEKLGFSQEEILGNQWFLSIKRTKAEIRKKTEYIKNVLNGRILLPESYETWISDKEGKKLCVLWQDTIAPGKVLISIGVDITERKETEKIMRVSEQMNNGILSSLSTHIGVLDSNGVIIATNPAWDGFTEGIKNNKKGRAKKGENYLVEIKKATDNFEIYGGIYKGILSVMERKQKYYYADYQSNQGNGQKWFTIRVTPFAKDKGVVITHTNITERVLTNLALKESEHKFRQLTETIEEAFWLFDWKTKKAIYVSPAYEVIYGRPYQSLTKNNRSWVDHIHPDDKKWVIKAYDNNAEKGTYDIEFRIIHHDGAIKWIHERAFPIKEGGSVIRMAGYSSDITVRRNVQNELSKSEEEYRLLFERNLCGVYKADMNNVIIECNNSFAKIIGLKSRSEMINKNARDFYQNVGKRTFSEKLIFNGGDLNGFESELKLNDGRSIWVLENASIVKNKDGSDEYVEGTIIEITKLKEAELQIEALAKFPEENPNPVLRIDNKANVIFVNQAGEALAKEITTTSNKLIPAYKNNIDRAVKLNKTIEIEQKVNDKVYAFSIRPVKEYDYVNIYAKDITERTRIDLIREITFIISRKAGSKIRSLNALSRIIHHELSKVIAAKNLFLAMYSKSSNRISFPYFKDEKILNRGRKFYRDREYGKGFTERVIKSRKPLLIKGDEILSYVQGEEDEYGVLPKSWVGVPLIKDGEVFGVLAIQSYDSYDAYTNESVEILDFVARQIASLVERANSTALILKQQNDLNLEKEKLKDQRDLALQYQSMLLSSQLNPHFIFNSLNSIQYFILGKETMPALNFLTDFSSLMRCVLTNSAQKHITLTKEIVFLEMYLNLELIRYSEKFHYKIIIGEDVDTEDLLIPPMLLQPFIENTVIHGVGNLVSGGMITIKFNKKGSKVECVIKDNGVGRMEAARLKIMRKGSSSQSFSTDINSSRIEILNSLESKQYSAKIKDLFGRTGKPIGTNVVVTFPALVDE